MGNGFCLRNNKEIADDPSYINWNKYEDLNARFDDPFEPIHIEGMTLNENATWLYNINRRLDYYKRWPILKSIYSQILFEPSLYDNI